MTTARTKIKAEKLKKRYAEFDPAVFDVVIVEDIAKEGAFDEAVVSSPPFDGVCHPTSPFHFAVTGTSSQVIQALPSESSGILTLWSPCADIQKGVDLPHVDRNQTRVTRS